MTLMFRKMTVDDIPAVFEVRTSTAENAITMEELSEYYGITPESTAKVMASHVSGWVCDADGRVVGFAMGDESNGEVQVLAVHPDYEDRGIGKTLLTEVTHWLFSKGHEQVWLGANPDSKVRAHGFYRSLGWKPTGEMTGQDEILVLTAKNENKQRG